MNGFDGLYTMLGIIVGSYVAGHHDPRIVLGTGLAGIFALGASGVATSYLSESAERKRELKKLEKHMLINLKDTIHHDANKFASFSTALVNGFSPVVVSLVMVSPFFLATFNLISNEAAFPAAVLIGVVEIFSLGYYLGIVSGEKKISYGLKMLVVATVTAAISFIVASIFE